MEIREKLITEYLVVEITVKINCFAKSYPQFLQNAVVYSQGRCSVFLSGYRSLLNVLAPGALSLF